MTTTIPGLAQPDDGTTDSRPRKLGPARIAIPDPPGCDLCPDPLRATTAFELVGALRRYRIWAGEPSFREMAAANERVSASTLCSALGRDVLPSLDVVSAIVIGCGGSDQDLQRFAAAWRRIRLADFPETQGRFTVSNDPHRPAGQFST